MNLSGMLPGNFQPHHMISSVEDECLMYQVSVLAAILVNEPESFETTNGWLTTSARLCLRFERVENFLWADVEGHSERDFSL